MKKQCPICGKKVEKPKKENQNNAQTEDFFPFCSKRCKLIDLNAWFESKYVISSPIEKQKDNEQDEPEI